MNKYRICDQHVCFKCDKDIWNAEEKWDFDIPWNLIQMHIWSPEEESNKSDHLTWNHICLCKKCREELKEWLGLNRRIAIKLLAEEPNENSSET